MRYLWGLLFLTGSLFGFDYHLKSYTMAEGVECFFGLSSKVSEINGGNTVNSCYIKTNEGYVVIDSGPTYSYAQQAFRVMEEQAPLPVKYVINTSSEDVHILGNGFYQERGAKLMGPVSYQSNEQEKHIALQENVSENTFRNTRLVPLDTYIDDDLTFTIGDVEIKVIKVDKKSDRYLLVYIPSKGILFVGDMVFNNRIPALKHNRSLLNWLQSLKRIEQMSWQRVISSHGIKTKHSALKNTTSYLKMLRDEVNGCVDKSLSKEACINEIKMYAFIEDNLYEDWHANNVGVAYDELNAVKPKTPLPAPKVDIKKVDKQAEPKKIVKKEEPKPTQRPPIVTPEVKQPIERQAPIQSFSFNTALQKARANKKIVLLKIRSDNCPYCDELDNILRTNNTVKKLINENYIMTGMNNSREELPLGIEVRLTPSLAFVRPDTKQVVMITPGIEALGELIDILKEGVQDGRRNGYLK